MSAVPVKVLLIEDNEALAMLLELEVKHVPQANVVMKHVVTLAEGVRRCQLDPVDVVLLDLWLPDSVGMATLVSLRAQIGNKIPIVVLTALPDESMRAEALRLGAQEFIIKRADNAATIVTAIQRLVARS